MAENEHADWQQVGAAFRAFGDQLSAAVKSEAADEGRDAKQQLMDALSGLKEVANDPEATGQLKSATTQLLDAIATEVMVGKDALSDQINKPPRSDQQSEDDR
ncbi:MAG: hypothetical protein KDC39_04160 [Actinobacteria bacterium]|nr:hypothetical protein [Actinomycetota bacterium]